MFSEILTSAVVLSLGQSAFALPSNALLPQYARRGVNDFSLEGTYSLAPPSLSKRDGWFYGYGISTAWTVGGQQQVGFIDLGGGYFTTRNVSQLSDNANNGYYDIEKSSTVTKIPGAGWSQCFNDQCNHGPVVKDDMKVFDLSVPQVLVMACDDSCHGGSANWGLSHGLTVDYQVNGQTVTGPSWFGSLSSTLSNQLWTLFLDSGRGVFNFGYIDHQYYSGDVGYIPNNGSRAFWNGAVTGYSFSNGGPSSTTNTLQFWLDTGNGATGLPPSLFHDYHANIPGAVYDSSGNYHYPCDESLPDWTMNIGGVDVTIEGINFKGGVVSDNTCWTTFVSGGDFQDANAWGIDFLRGVFTVFEYGADGNDRIGFANKPKSS